MLKLSDRLYLERSEDLKLILHEFNPNVIFIDQFLSTDFIILFKLADRSATTIIFLNTMFPSYKNYCTPPITSAIIPKYKGLAPKWKVWFSWTKLLVKKRILRFIQMVIYFGRDDYSNIKRKVKANGMAEKYFLDRTVELGYSFMNMPELILAPQELQFNSIKARDHQHYLGDEINKTREGETFIEKYNSVKAFLIHKREQENCKIIYCSFGSRYLIQSKKILGFISKLLAVVKERKHFYLIISLAERLSAQISDLPENVFVFAKVPQIDMLEFTDLFITHGGLNSIKESIGQCVSMLVYPLDRFTDQPGNAARVEYHGLGLMGDITKNSERDLGDKLDYLINNGPEFHKKSLEMKMKIKERYTERYLENVLRPLVSKT